MDLWSLFCRRKRGAPEEWRWMKLEAVGDLRSPREHAAAKVTGGVLVDNTYDEEDEVSASERETQASALVGACIVLAKYPEGKR